MKKKHPKLLKDYPKPKRMAAYDPLFDKMDSKTLLIVPARYKKGEAKVCKFFRNVPSVLLTKQNTSHFDTNFYVA